MRASPLLARYRALKKQEAKLADSWVKFHAAAKAGGCQHEVVNDHKIHNDNGYGRWWTTFQRVCAFCEEVLESRTENGCL